MYRILLADDEGIMLTSLRNTIESTYGSECEIATAKTGRVAVELTAEFRPDIVFMDIKMPGLNGLEAIKEIRKQHANILFIVITAYDKFDYAKDAISLGTYDYLTKPVKKQVLLDVLVRAMQQVDATRKNKIDNIRIKEKLETVIPIIESGFINNVLMQEEERVDNEYYLELMDIKVKYGFVILLQFGENIENGLLTNPVGTSMRMQKNYSEIQALIKQHFNAIVGPLMSNKIVVVIPHEEAHTEYEERIQIIERTRNMLRNIEKQSDAYFRAGIGRTKELVCVKESYQEAYAALGDGKSQVAHIEDFSLEGGCDKDYPIDVEQKMLQAVEKNERLELAELAEKFFNWMVQVHASSIDTIRLKVLELVLQAEREATLNNGMQYRFEDRKNYLSTVIQIDDYGKLKQWFISKLLEVCHNISTRKEEQSISAVSTAKEYIMNNYDKDISLNDVSRMVNISPYYFSKLFKEEAGVNFIDFLTDARMEKAKELLKNSQYSIKEVCIKSGYSEPNYFSRIFKKHENITPSEYREGR